MRIVIGTRGSELAMVQAGQVRTALEAAYEGLKCELCIIKTSGDNCPEKALVEIGEVGLFTRQIEKSLLNGDIDLAVHSYKDLPAVITEGLVIASVPVREDGADVLVAKAGLELSDLPLGAKVLTGSARRKAQLLHIRKDLQVAGVRGNIHTRLRKLREGDADAMVLAAAGLNRLGLQDEIAERFDVWDFIPACGQGALALQCRVGDDDTIEVVRLLDDANSRVGVEAERSFLRSMGAGCSMPVGAYARVEAGKVQMKAMLASTDGEKVITVQVSGPRQQCEEIGNKAALEILQNNGRKIVKSMKME